MEKYIIGLWFTNPYFDILFVEMICEWKYETIYKRYITSLENRICISVSTKFVNKFTLQEKLFLIKNLITLQCKGW